jgi:TusA-related sulfurtransferase
MAISKMRELESGEIEVLVDNATSKENVTRAGQKSGWELAEIKEEGEEYRLLFKRA